MSSRLLAPYKERITLPVAVDIEDARYRRNSRQLNSTLALEFMRIVGEAGYQTMLYTNRDFLQNYYDDEMLGDIPIWFALYRNPRSDENVPQDWAEHYLLAVERRRYRQRLSEAPSHRMFPTANMPKRRSASAVWCA